MISSLSICNQIATKKHETKDHTLLASTLLTKPQSEHDFESPWWEATVDRESDTVATIEALCSTK